MTRAQRNYITGICTIVLIAALIWPRFGQAESIKIPDVGETLPQEIENGLSYLLELVQDKGAAFNPALIIPLLDFAAKGTSYDPEQLAPKKRQIGFGACLRAEVKAPLERILRYAYNPQIPCFVVYPNVLRLSGWYPDSDIVTRKIELWNELSSIDQPLLLWGREYEENTPDLFSGAYYRYDLDRLVILMKHEGKQVLISVSKMPAPSQVGEKAVIIDDKNWNYFYSGIKGIARRFISPLETYIYDSASIQIIYQTDPAGPRTLVMLYKWLKAGWADLNLVRRSHIYEGGIRFIQGLKEVMESKDLPDSDVFAQGLDQLEALSEAEIDAKIRSYSQKFESIAKENKEMSQKDFARIISNGGYAKVLNREERLGVLALEYFKNQLGKTALVDFDSLSPVESILAKSGTEVLPPTAKPLRSEVFRKNFPRFF